jgi:hypothetical protein
LVTIHVLSPAQPEINVTPISVTVTLAPGESTTSGVSIQNLGDADLTWSVAENPAAAWLAESLAGGTLTPGGSYDLLLTFNASSLAAGTYTTNLEISSNDADEPLVTVSVTLEVVENPTYNNFLPIVLR